MKIRRPPGVTDNQPNLMPVVNVAMVVLIVFMIGASFAGPESYLKSNLPFKPTGGGGAALPKDWVPDQPLDVFIDSPTPDRFTATVGNQKVEDETALAGLLAAKRQQLAAAGSGVGDVTVQISPGRTVHYRYLIKAQEAAQLAGFKKITFTTAR